MFTAWILLMLNSLFFTLRLSGGGSGSFPRPLKAEEERMYLERMAQGDLEARNILIEHNLRLVAHIMKKYYTPNGDQDDLISIGTIGLIKGISTFKPDKNVRLATYASRCIENEILMHFRAQRKLQGGPECRTCGRHQHQWYSQLSGYRRYPATRSMNTLLEGLRVRCRPARVSRRLWSSSFQQSPITVRTARSTAIEVVWNCLAVSR